MEKVQAEFERGISKRVDPKKSYPPAVYVLTTAQLSGGMRLL